MDNNDNIRKAELIARCHAYFVVRAGGLIANMTGDVNEAQAFINNHLDAGQRAAFERAQESITKGAVGANVLDGNLGVPPAWPGAFLDLVKGGTALDNIGAATVPLNIQAALTNSSTDFDWIGPGKPAPASNMVTASGVLDPFKIGGVRVATRELLRLSSPSAAAVLERDMQRSVAIAVDRCAWDPSRAASAGVSPASLTHGATAIPSSGGAGENFETDVADLLLTISGGNPERPYIILNRRVRTYLQGLRTTTGQPAFPDLGRGEILGAPVVVGLGVPDAIIAVDGAALVIADGGVEISMSEQSALEMSDAPSQSGITGSGANLTSTFQAGLAGLKAIRWLNWQKRSDAVAYRLVGIGGSPV